MSRVVLAAAVALCTAAGAADTTVIGGHTYVFPPGTAMEGGTVGTGRVGSMLIELAWPEMRPLTPAEASAWPIRNTIRILVISGAPVDGDAVPDSELLADMPERLSVMTDPGDNGARASRHIPLPQLDPDPVASVDAAPGNGMLRLQVKDFRPDLGRRDVFATEPLAHPEQVISCDRLERGIVNAGCAQVFVSANMILQASYPRPLVRQWREIEAGTVAFFKMHEVHP